MSGVPQPWSKSTIFHENGKIPFDRISVSERSVVQIPGVGIFFWSFQAKMGHFSQRKINGNNQLPLNFSVLGIPIFAYFCDAVPPSSGGVR